MKERSLDEMVAYFNHRVLEMDIAQNYKIELLGMVTALGYKHEQTAQPDQQHGRVFKGIVVEYPAFTTYPECKGKPYFSIKYTENGQEFIGYGTYKPEVLSEYLKEYFMPSAEPEIIRCGECVNHLGNRCLKADHHTSDKACCMSVFHAKRKGAT